MDTFINSDIGNNQKSVWKRFFIALYRYKGLYLFLLPAVIWFFVFKYIPLYGVLLGFKEYQFDKGIMGSAWVGTKYLKEFVNSFQFGQLIKNTLTISLLKLIICFPCPIILALMLNEVRNNKFKQTIQTISYLPYFVSWVVVVALLTKFLSPNDGVINELRAKFFGAEPIYYMGSKEYFYYIVVLSHIWKTAGWSSIIYLAAISGISQELYEAATIDGAGKFRCMLHITLPGIVPTITILFILNVGSIMSAGFDQMFLLQNPAVIDIAEVIDTHVVKSGIQQGHFSYSVIVGLFQSAIGFVLIVITNYLCKRFSETSLW